MSPFELVWLTTRILGYKEESNEEMQVEIEDLWDQIREDAIKREERVKRATRHYYNAKVIPKKFRKKRETRPKWKGPYVIKEEVRLGTVCISQGEWEEDESFLALIYVSI